MDRLQSSRAPLNTRSRGAKRCVPRNLVQNYLAITLGQVTQLRSKHGIIIECKIDTDCDAARQELKSYGASLVGERYSFVQKKHVASDGPSADVSAWLAHYMDQ